MNSRIKSTKKQDSALKLKIKILKFFSGSGEFIKMRRNGIKTKKPFILAIIIFITISMLILIHTLNTKNSIYSNTEIVSEQIKLDFENYFCSTINSSILFRDFWNHTSSEADLYNHSRFNSLVEKFYSMNTHITAFNWLNADGVIKWVYPYEPNKAAINKSIIYFANGDFNYAFNYSRHSYEIGISDPIELYQGGKAFVFYIPIIYNNNLTGFFNLVLRISEFFNTNYLQRPILQGYEYYVYYNDSLLVKYNANDSFSGMISGIDFRQYHSINILYKQFDLLIYPRRAYIEQNFISLNVALITVGGIGVIITFIFAVLLNKQFIITEKYYKDKIEMEKNLFQARKMEALGTLAGGIAHDMNNILQGVVGNISLIKMDLTPNMSEEDLKEIQENINGIEELTKRAHELTQQILDYSRKSQIELEPLNLNHIVLETINIFKKSIDKRIKVIAEIPEKVYFILGNRTKLLQSLLNIFVNSRDAIEKEGVIRIVLKDFDKNRMPLLMNKIYSDGLLFGKYSNPSREHSSGNDKVSNVSIDSTLATNQKKVCIEIEDNGKGMDQEQLNHIFEPFYTTKERGKGTGLGLTMVDYALSSMKGQIYIESEVNKGTRVSIVLPLIETPKHQDASQLQSSSSDLKQYIKRVLIIEDELP
ncbi:MAG: ATP-binding protein, partial [Promethearchaeota archaeon]